MRVYKSTEFLSTVGGAAPGFTMPMRWSGHQMAPEALRGWRMVEPSASAGPRMMCCWKKSNSCVKCWRTAMRRRESRQQMLCGESMDISGVLCLLWVKMKMAWSTLVNSLSMYLQTLSLIGVFPCFSVICSGWLNLHSMHRPFVVSTRCRVLKHKRIKRPTSSYCKATVEVSRWSWRTWRGTANLTDNIMYSTCCIGQAMPSFAFRL